MNDFELRQLEGCESLQQAHAVLHNILKELCSSKSIDFQRISHRIQDAHKFLYELNYSIVQSINQLTRSIFVLIQERQDLYIGFNSFKESYASKLGVPIMSEEQIATLGNGNDVLGTMINIDSKEAVDEKPQSSKGKRYPKEKVDILEKWFENHRESPYLSRDDTNILADMTGFTRDQIRVWVANKRRRDKRTCISQEIAHLLN